MASWQDAVQPAPDGVDIDLEVTPGARETRFPSGHNAWRNRIQARLAAPAQDGKANEELRQAASAFFQISPRDVQLLEGLTSRQKRLRLLHLTHEAALKRLAEALA